MAQVIVKIAERPYTMQCPAGEEEHLQELARLLDTEVQRVKRQVGQVGDVRQLVMAGLMVADRLSETLKRVEDLEDQVNGLKESRNQIALDARALEHEMTEKLDAAARRLEALTRTLG